MNKNFIFPESDDFDEYPEIAATDLEGAIHRRNLLEVPKKQSVNLMLDADIIAWFKKKSGEVEFQSLINAALRDVISHNP
ncbi:MAG: BrnA antitoxin family protein [Methylococcales bacterium]|nr:BrnA antitoxin family protein [Methylococcales bacterium]